jgi:hypothetical protein
MYGVTRRRLAGWLLAIPLMGAGSQVAHVFAYRLVYPEAHVRLRELLATGHGYLGYTPVLLGFGAAVELAAFASILAGTVRRRRYDAVRPWAFALLPPLGFVIQEFLERWLAGSSFPWWMVQQPTFRIGLLLQLPFALAAYLLARLLLRVADRVGDVLHGALEGARLEVRTPGWPAFDFSPPRVAALAGGHAGRGPPPAFAAAISTTR